MLRRHQSIAFANSIHFITLVTHERGQWFIASDLCREILTTFERCRAKQNLECFGYVLMPDHLHALLCQRNEGSHVPKLVQDFKKFTSRYLKPNSYPDVTLWRTRYDDVPVPGPKAAATRVEYMHTNPIRRDLATLTEDYPWSSARDYAGLEKGIVTIAPL